MNIYKVLDNLNIEYEEISHNPIMTSHDEEIKNIINKINGEESKNLFLKSKENYYLVVISSKKKADLKEIANIVHSKRLEFANPTELKDILSLEIGAVTPLGIINDKNNLTTLLIDSFLKDKKILMHTNTNTKTISIKYEDLLKIISYTKHKYYTF